MPNFLASTVHHWWTNLVQARNVMKPRSSSSSQGIMVSVWKFHKEDDDNEAALSVPDFPDQSGEAML